MSNLAAALNGLIDAPPPASRPAATASEHARVLRSTTTSGTTTSTSEAQAIQQLLDDARNSTPRTPDHLGNRRPILEKIRIGPPPEPGSDDSPPPGLISVKNVPILSKILDHALRDKILPAEAKDLKRRMGINTSTNAPNKIAELIEARLRALSASDRNIDSFLASLSLVDPGNSLTRALKNAFAKTDPVDYPEDHDRQTSVGAYLRTTYTLLLTIFALLGSSRNPPRTTTLSEPTIP